MYYVTPQSNLSLILTDILQKHFGDKAEVKWIGNCKIEIKVKEDAGFKDEHKYLTQEEIDQGVYGGGLKCGLDGKSFIVEVKPSV